MSQRKIGLREVLKDIKLGIDDTGLKERYKLSEQGLKSLYDQLFESGLLEREGEHYFIPGKRRISTREIVGDILSGLTDLELMKKYKLSSRKLQKVFSKLADAGTLTLKELSDRNSPQDRQTNLPRAAPRVFSILSAIIYEKANPTNRGTIRDLSDEGVGTRGLAVELDETKTLIVEPDAFLEVEPFSFQARCRWSSIADDGESNSGFEIIFISGSDRMELQKLIQLMTVLL
jgi:hypothetical protein